MAENNQMMSVEGQLVGMPLAGPESFSQQQLDYLKRALGVDETVLMNTPTVISNNLVITLTENFTNFAKIKIFCARRTSSNVSSSDIANEFEVTSEAFNISCSAINYNSGTTNLMIDWFSAQFSGSSLTIKRYSRKDFSNSSFSTATDAPLTITKIVGIHRIAGGN